MYAASVTGPLTRKTASAGTAGGGSAGKGVLFNRKSSGLRRTGMRHPDHAGRGRAACSKYAVKMEVKALLCGLEGRAALPAGSTPVTCTRAKALIQPAGADNPAGVF